MRDVLVLVSLMFMAGIAQPRSVRSAGTAAQANSAVIGSLEHTWLATRDTRVLTTILAPDFVHITPGGYFLNRAQHLVWVATHPHPSSLQLRFGGLSVRVCGDASIANGIVVATDTTRQGVSRNDFTDVFVTRGGRWHAVNAQEDPMEEKAP